MYTDATHCTTILRASRDIAAGEEVTVAYNEDAVWKPLHTIYWNGLLQPFGLTVSDDMPFWAEPFTLLHDRG